MADVTREPLSGGTSGRPIQIVGTTNVTANVLHTSGGEDAIYIWAVSRHTSSVILTLQLGAQATAEQIPILLEPNRPELVLDGAVLTGSLVLDAFAALTNVCSCWGFVNRIVD